MDWWRVCSGEPPLKGEVAQRYAESERFWQCGFALAFFFSQLLAATSQALRASSPEMGAFCLLKKKGGWASPRGTGKPKLLA